MVKKFMMVFPVNLVVQPKNMFQVIVVWDVMLKEVYTNYTTMN